MTHLHVTNEETKTQEVSYAQETRWQEGTLWLKPRLAQLSMPSHSTNLPGLAGHLAFLLSRSSRVTWREAAE